MVYNDIIIHASPPVFNKKVKKREFAGLPKRGSAPQGGMGLP